MKTTLDLPDDLMRAIRMRAAREDRTLKDLTTDLLRRGMSSPPPAHGTGCLPVIECPRSGALDPQAVDDALLSVDVDAVLR